MLDVFFTFSIYNNGLFRMHNYCNLQVNIYCLAPKGSQRILPVNLSIALALRSYAKINMFHNRYHSPSWICFIKQAFYNPIIFVSEHFIYCHLLQPGAFLTDINCGKRSQPEFCNQSFLILLSSFCNSIGVPFHIFFCTYPAPDQYFAGQS